MGQLTLLLAALVASASAVPMGSRQTCSTTCSDATKFSFDSGFSYNYQYEVKTTASRTPYDEESKTNIRGKATVGVIAPCEFVLTLSDIVLDESSESKEFSAQLEKNPLKFGFDDGKISSVCSSNYDKEHEWVLNFKRGILSTFQNNMKDRKTEVVKEVDVTGTCDTTYTSLTSSGDTIVEKKEKNDCLRIPSASHTSLPEPLQKLPIISADQVCEQTITAGVMTKVVCKEILALNPLHDSKEMLMTVVDTKLDYEGQTTGVAYTGGDFSLETIEFTQNKKIEEDIQEQFMMVEQILGELTLKSYPTMDSQVPSLFSDLVSHLRNLDVKHLKLIYQSNKGTRVWRFLIDAAPLVGTAASTEVVVELIKQNDMSAKEADIWYASLPYIQKPEVEMFNPLIELVQQDKSTSALIGVASLIKQFCKTNEHCMERKEISSLVGAMENILGSGCRTTNMEEKSKVLTVLRSLTIAGVWNRQDVLEKCFEDERNPDDIRVGALTAFLNAPCSYDRSRLMSVYSDSKYDYELRISAYLSLMSCPTEELIMTIKQKLESESVNQVGAFVWSHLSNLQESASHEKQSIRLLVGDDDLVRKFNSSDLKLSRNMESSFYMESLGTGSTIESNIIFSKKSFLPRSGMFNFSVDLFGETINLFEVGGRFEGFEIFAEKFFGPHGYYPDETVAGVLSSLRQSKMREETYNEGSFEQMHDEPEGSYYLRILGNDVHYHNFHGIENFFEKSPEFDMTELISRLLSSGKTGFSHTYQIMDTELIYPTISGLPLKITLNGSATIGLDIDGDFKFNSVKDIDINGHLYPSSAFELDASMVIDSQFKKSGIKQSIAGQTSLEMEGSIKIEGSKIIDIDIKMPKDEVMKIMSLKSKTELIGASTEMVVYNENDLEENCGNIPVLGLSICQGHIYESNYKEISYYIKKTDEHDSYKFKFSKDQDRVTLLIDTPNSVHDRRISFEGFRNGNKLVLDIHTPWKTLNAETSYSFSDNPKFSGKAIIDSKSKYDIMFDSNVHSGRFGESVFSAKPSFVVKSSGQAVIDISGSIERNQAEKMMKFKVESHGLMEFSGEVSRNENELKTNISSSLINVSAIGRLDLEDKFQSNLDIEYSIKQSPKEKMNFYLELKKESSGYTTNHFADTKISIGHGVDLAATGSLEIHNSQDKYQLKSKLKLGDDFVTEYEYLRKFSSGVFYDIMTKYSINSVHFDLSGTEELHLSQSNLVVNNEVKINDMEYKTEIESEVLPENGFLKTVIEIPTCELKHKITYKMLGDRHYSADMSSEYNDRSFEGEIEIQDKSVYGKKIDFEVGLKSKLEGDSRAADLKFIASDEKVKINFKHRSSQGLDSFKLKATSRSISLNSNIIKPVSIEAKIDAQNSKKVAEISGSVDGKTLDASLRLSNKRIEGNLIFGEFMKKFIGEILDNGATIQLYISPEEKIEGSVKYEFGSDDSYISLALETPFAGYHKQSFHVGFQVGAHNEFSAQSSVTWKNIQIFSTSANVKLNSANTKLDLKINADESYFGISRGVFSVDHKMGGSSIETSINGNIDGTNVLRGNFKALSTDTFNKKMDVSLKSTLMDEIKVSLLLNTLKNFEVDLVHGSKSLKANYEVTNPSNSVSEIKFIFDSPQITKVSGKASLTTEGERTSLKIEGLVREMKYSADFVYTVKPGKEYELKWRMIQPNVSPIRGNLSVSTGAGGKYVGTLNFNRFWSDFEKVELHSVIVTDSSRKMKFNVKFVTPETRSFIDSSLLYDLNRVSVAIKAVHNDEKYTISTDVHVDEDLKKIVFDSKFKHNDSSLFQTSLNYEQKLNVKDLKINFELLGFSLDVTDKLICHSDMLNFENTLEGNVVVNGKRHYANIQSNVLLKNKKIDVFATFDSNTYGIHAAFQPNSTNEKIILEVLVDDEKYSVSVGGELKNDIGSFNLRVKTPIADLEDVKFSVTINNSSSDKHIAVQLKKSEENIISFKGNLIGDFMEIELLSPFEGLRNFHSYASMNRSKRSVEFSVMNEDSSAGIVASFNSLSMHMKSTLLGSEKDASLVLKNENGKVTLDYHRGKRYINLIIQPTGQRRSFNLTLKSEISGMEFLALIGRLDGNTASFSSQLNEDKMSIEGTGKISRLSGDLKFTIQTPFEGYGVVNVNLSYNMRRGKFILNATSPGSDFKISFERNVIDIYIPNSIQPTIVKGKFALYDSNLSVSSRFPFLKSFNYQHKVSMGSGSLSVSTTINYNGLEVFKFTMNRNASQTQVSINLRRQGHHSEIFLKKVGFESLEFMFKRDGKQFKVKVYGSGNMPTSGKYSFIINNDFRETPRTVQGDLTVDRTGSQKKILLEVSFPHNRKYKIDLQYNINLQRPQTGTYTLRLTVPDRGLLPLVQGSWNLANHDDINVRFAYGRMNVIVSGKLHLLESDLEINGIGPNPFKIIWRYHKESSYSQRTRDHFVHVGFPDRFVMFKLKGTASGLRSGDMETAVQIKRFMPSPFEAHVTWSRDSTGLKGQGSFTLGSRSGEFNLKKLKRDASTRSLTISFEAKTNIPSYKRISVEGNYSFNNGAVFNLDVTWDVSKFAVHFDITDIMNKRTNQTASLSIPGLGDVQIEFGHDFRRNKKKFRIVAKYGGRESHLKADWTINNNYTKGSTKIDVQSRFLGHISLKANYDVQDINNASAKVDYKRENKFFHINWTRKLTANELNAKLTFESSNSIVPSAKIEVHAEFTNGFSLNVLLQRSDRKINLKFKMTAEGIEAELQTPYQGFELIKGKLTYDLRRSQKTVHLSYERGDRKMNVDISVRAQRRRGKITLSATTPFDFMKSLEIKANWQNGKGKLTYNRNNTATYTLSGDFDIKSNSSSVDLTFVPSSGAPMNIAFSFNAGSLVSGNGQGPEDLAKLSLDVFQKHIKCTLKGYRNSSKIYLEFEAESSFEQLRTLKFKLDSGLDTQKREGLFELYFNDFHFKVENSFERMAGSGFYWRSEFDSTLTKLPGLVIGFGREGDHTILTVGAGEGNELTIKFKIEDNKVSGELSIPSLNIRDAHYEASYRFTSPNVLKLNVLIDLQSGKKFEATVIYDSDGVQGRLTSSHFGNHSARVRRSVSNDGFLGEIGFDDYRILLSGNLLRNDIKRGFEIKTEILGETVSIEAFVENNGQTNGQMKFLVETSFEGYEKLGGLLSYKVEDNRIMGNTELYTSSNSYPKILGMIEINKSSSKIHLDISGKTYVLELSSIRKYNNGYEASLKIETPHYAISHINLNGKFRTDAMKNLDAKLEISYPEGSLKLNCRYDVASANMFTDVLIDYTHQNAKMFHFDSKINGVSDKLDAEINLNSKYMRQPFRMGFLAERKSKFDAQLKTMMSVNGMQHVFEFESKKVTENHVLTLLISSPNTQGRHYIMMEYNLFNFNQIKRFEASLSYTGASTSSVSLVYAENIKLQVISPYGKYEIQADITRNKFSLSCNSPNCHHEFVLNMHKDLDNFKYDMNLKTSLLPYEVSYLIEMNMKSSNKFFFESTLTMDTTHSLKVESSHNMRNIDVSFNLETSLFDINRFDVNSKIFNDRNKEASMEIVFAGKTHRFNIKFNESESKISFLVNSPYLSGETLKAEASVNTTSEKLDLDALLRFDGKTFSTKFRYRNTEKMYASLEVKTPYKGYRKMNFVASYEQTDKIVVTFNANKPLKLKFEVEVGKDGEKYVSSIDIVTPFVGYENISVNAVVPMNKIAPKVTLNILDEEYALGFELDDKKYSKECQFEVSIGGTQYSAGGQIRYKAPFELGYFYRLPSINKRFHIMTDSSIYKAVVRPLFIMW